MTICAGMLCTDGIVLCADTLESVGSVHRSVEKLVELPIASGHLTAVVVCATEDAVFSDALIEKISDSLDRSDGTFASAKDAIEDATLKYCADIWKALGDTQNKPMAEMLIGLKAVDDMRLLHLSTPTVRTIETWEFIGYGRELGIYKAGQYGLKNMPTDTAAPIIAYIVDIVKNNVQFCGRTTNLAVLHVNGTVEHKAQDYIAKTTQGYKSIEWFLDTWIFPFLPLAVSDAGNDILSMIGELGEPKTNLVKRIPEFLKILKARKDSILAGEIPAIPEKQKHKLAFSGIPFAAKVLQNTSAKLYAENLIGEEAKNSLDARCTTILNLSEVVCDAIDSGLVDHNGLVDQETIRQSIERICLLYTAPVFLDQILFEEEDQPQELMPSDSQTSTDQQ